ncbi:hypothetical protein MUK42_16878 [Musa troglodytarum]|uniref:Uncharacterized protein n=1 Tax=Musa troglodytarum TaxID=320322 RepID=A0A9E7KYX8_9LILI|nr:hypothetical protein MUK42_16878 [Musa troglodytarum]
MCDLKFATPSLEKKDVDLAGQTCALFTGQRTWQLAGKPHSRSPCSSRAMLILYTISAKKVAAATCRAGSLRPFLEDEKPGID